MKKENDKTEIVANMLRAMGHESYENDENLMRTPERVVKSWEEIYAGYDMNPEKILSTSFPGAGYQQMVSLSDIEMYSVCSHHMLPFFGKAHVAYIPKERVVGLSKLARLVDCFSRRLQIQERLTEQIAEAMVKYLDPKGVMVVIEAQHMCMTMRGVGKQNSVMTTSAIKGAFKDQAVRQEFLSLRK